MDPYTTLGLSPYANQDDLKRAFRKEAMKWHPDRTGDSAEAKEKFQQISQAYQVLTREFKSRKRKEANHSASEQRADSLHDCNDDVFREVMLEYAIGLVRSGLTHREIRNKVLENGCDASMAASIAAQACQFTDEFTAQSARRSNSNKNGPAVNTRKFDYASIQALFGKHNPGSKVRKTISDYHEIFNNLYAREEAGALFLVNRNRYLGKLFNLSMLLFILIAAMVYYLPVVERLLALGMIDYFQLPNILLSLMLVWSVYRKLWLLSSIGVSLFAISQLYYYTVMPGALEGIFTTILMIALTCYLPFIFLTHFSNFFYYLKAKHIIDSVSRDYPHPQDQLVIIKNRGGVSRLFALLATIALALYFLHMIPQNGSLNNKYDQLFSIAEKTESRGVKQVKARISESKRLFNIGEKYYSRTPPDYEHARMAYIKSAEYGSLLSAYKLGYMFFMGEGGNQDDNSAFIYFSQAVNSPLAAQPHSLSTATKWLSESYNNLGIMYLGGYGTARNRNRARDMFRQARKYGSSKDLLNLTTSNKLINNNLRSLVLAPDYDR